MSDITTVLFDLDGTLLDTAPDFVFALNTLLLQHGKALLPADNIRNVVSQGTEAMLMLGFGIAKETLEYEQLRTQFLAIYRANLTKFTLPFAGINEVLQAFTQLRIGWGIVTNKPGDLTIPLLQQIQLHTPPACIVAGDTIALRKPDPAPLLHACNILQCAPASCVYVGDTENDIIAGQKAGMRTIVAEYGYRSISNDPYSWHADGYIKHPLDLLDWINTEQKKQKFT